MQIRSIVAVAVAAGLTACANSPKTDGKGTGPVATQPAAPPHPYALPERPVRTVSQAPRWFTHLPKDTAEMTFAVGTATSVDEQMAYDKARMAAERKLVEQMYSRISTQTNNFRSDRGQVLIENFQQITRKNAQGDLIGAQRVDSQVTHDGQFYKVYVLLRLPIGDANLMQSRRDQQRMQQEADLRGRAAEREMDANNAAQHQRELEANRELERRLAPTTPPASAPRSAVPKVDMPTSQDDARLLEVNTQQQSFVPTHSAGVFLPR